MTERIFNRMRRGTLALVAGAFLSAGVIAPSALALDPADKPAIEKIIRDYLLANPELMLEVQAALEAKQKAEAQARVEQSLKNNKELIFASLNQGIIGNKNGDVTVVEFFDYNCSFCQRAMNDMNALLANDKKLKFVMKELPILSRSSVEASRISTAVYRLYPDKYTKFHNTLLGTTGIKDGASALQIAQSQGMDVEKLQAEGAKPDVLGAFREVNELAQSLGINGTPSYVIGNEVIFGALGQQVLAEKIANMRKCGRTTCS